MIPAQGHKGEEMFGFNRKCKGELIAIYTYLEGRHGKLTLTNGQIPTHPESHPQFSTDQEKKE